MAFEVVSFEKTNLLLEGVVVAQPTLRQLAYLVIEQRNGVQPILSCALNVWFGNDAAQDYRSNLIVGLTWIAA